MKNENRDKTTNSNENTTDNPNFVLWDNRISSDFLKMCQKFQEQSTTQPENTDWVIIDNDTGNIIYQKK